MQSQGPVLSLSVGQPTCSDESGGVFAHASERQEKAKVI